MQVKCGICGAECWYDPVNSFLPEVCPKCCGKHEAYIKALGLGAGRSRIPCLGCGKMMVVTANAKAIARCPKCKVRHDRKTKEENAVVDPEVRRRRFQNAMTLLRRQHGEESYQAPMGVIATKLYKPGWWDSAPEIMLTAEFLRLGHKVKPQFRVNKHRADIYLPDLNLIVEVDGELYHSSGKAIRRDIKYDAVALLEGHSVVRIRSKLVYDDVRKAARVALKYGKNAADYNLQREQIAWRSENRHLVRQAHYAAMDRLAVERHEARKKRERENWRP